MSKSIYEEALDILRDSLQDPQDEDNDCYMLDFEQMNNIVKTISQAQKQAKLLELYRKLSAIRHDMETIKMDIEKQIKELENEYI